MNLRELEMAIFNCPHVDSIDCDGRIRCHPIPGCGSDAPEFLVLGINPGRRRGIWCKYDSLKELEYRYLAECINPQYDYGKFLERLVGLIPRFDIPNTVYLSDLVKCPTVKGNPSRKMFEKCVSTYLEKTIRILDPKFIIGLGMQPSLYVGGFFLGGAVRSRLIKVAGHDYWFISVPHPRRSNIEIIAADLHKIVEEPETGLIAEFEEVFYPLKNKEIGNIVERKLMNLDYKKRGKNNWVKGNRVVHVVRSSEFGRSTRIKWKEEWKDDHAIVYDYSVARGPICVVPVSVLFMSDFVREKRRSDAYANSGYWWSQVYPPDHELVKLILSFEGRWDIV